MKLSIEYLKKLILSEVKEAKRKPKPIPPDIAAAQKAAEKSGVPSEMGQALSPMDQFLDTNTQPWIDHFKELHGNIDHRKIIELVEDLYGRIEEAFGLNKHGSK